MNPEAPQFLKGACTACGGHIEFPAEALDVSVACPHCGTETKLLANLPPARPPAPAPAPVAASSKQRAQAAPAAPKPEKAEKPAAAPKQKPEKFSIECPGCGLEVSVKADVCPSCGAVIREKSGLNWKLVLTSVVVIAGVGGAIYYFQGPGKSPRKPSAPTKVLAKASTEAKKPVEPEAPKVPSAPPPPTPANVKRSGEFKVTDYKIERTPGRSLVYVIGNVTNDTEKQQFSVRVKFDLFDKRGGAVGSATDYVTVIEPGNGWQFRALILDTNAVEAKLTGIETDKQ